MTPKMLATLKDVAYGVRLYPNGYFCIDDPTRRIDTRSLNALYRRGLIDWRGYGGSTHQIHVFLTETGNEIFKNLQAAL